MKKTFFSKRIYKQDIKEESESIIDDLVVFNAMVRRAYALHTITLDKNRKLEESIHQTIKNEFLVNDYYANSAVQEAKAIRKSDKEKHNLHIQAVESKINQIEKKIKTTKKMLSNKEKALDNLIKIHKVVVSNKTASKPKKIPKFKTYSGAREYLKSEETLTFAVRRKNDEDIYNIYEFEVCYLKPTIKRLKHRLKMLTHRLNKTKLQLETLKKSNPTTCFGSKSFFKKQHTLYKRNHDLWQKKWFEKRNRKMTISGRRDASAGNFVFRYDIDNNELNFTTMLGKKVALKNVIFPYGQEIVNKAITAPKEDRRAVAWSIENYDEYFIIKCIVDIANNQDINYSKADGIISVDTNVDHFAWANVDSKGNLLNSGTIAFDLRKKSCTQATAIIEKAVIELTKICVKTNKPLGMEDLDMKKASKELLYNSPKLNQKLSSFAYSKITSAIESRCMKDNVGLFKRNPAFTSQIGKVKYMKKKGLSIHTAAAYVIGRRCLNLKDKVPKEMKKFIPEQKIKNHHWSHWRQLSANLKEIHPKNFYKSVNLGKCTTIKDYKKLLV